MRNKMLEEILAIEWGMFTATENVGGQASCQRNPKGFEIMRLSQFENWDDASIESYLGDLRRARERDENLLTLKYAYMMESTDPEGYRAIAHRLPPLSAEKKALVEQLVERTMLWCREFAQRWPSVAAAGRSLESSSDSIYNTSVETYSRGEFSTYGEDTLKALLAHYNSLAERGINLHEKVVEGEMIRQGAPSLEKAEEILSRRR